MEREKRLERRRRKGKELSKDNRSRAAQAAFWAMHVEALSPCGMSFNHCAMAFEMSAHSLRRWRDLFEAEGISIDWRVRLHPTAVARISAIGKDVRPERPLTEVRGADLRPHRPSDRRLSGEQKLAIVLEIERPGTTVSRVVRVRNHRGVKGILNPYSKSETHPFDLAKGRFAAVARVIDSRRGCL